MNKHKKHSIDVVFVLLLFCVFAASALLTLLFGALSYSKVTEAMDKNYKERIYAGYISEKMRHCESAQSIQKGEIGGCDALLLTEKADEEEYITYIYYYDGSIRELFTQTGSGLGPEAGETIIKAAGFRTEYAGDGLIKTICIAEDGSEHYTLFSLK